MTEEWFFANQATDVEKPFERYCIVDKDGYTIAENVTKRNARWIVRARRDTCRKGLEHETRNAQKL